MSINEEIINRIRAAFLVDGTHRYHPKDVELVTTSDWWIERFVLSTKSEDAALKALSKAMEWRKSVAVNELSDDYFPEEFYKIGMYSKHCKDKDDRPVVWAVLKTFHKCSETYELLKQFIIHMFESADSQTSHGGWALVSDTTGAGISNLDMDLSRFLIEVVQSYYPLGPKYIMVIDLPWVLSATMKLILAFMGEQLRNTVKLVKKEEALQLIDASYMPVHLKGTYEKPLNSYDATRVRPLAQLSHTKYSSEQIKKFYSTFKSELKMK